MRDVIGDEHDTMQMLFPFRRIFLSLTCSPLLSLGRVSIKGLWVSKIGGSLLFYHILKDHIYVTLVPNQSVMMEARIILTDIVVKSNQRPAELCMIDQPHRGVARIALTCPPLSPFMTTHILEPTHLSTSSVEAN